MRLETIKLNGFKSFVDQTNIHLPSNLVGIVGPNGCGKSNVIDAVRWVMGETSAKQLRGSSIVDVIFNGSVNRKPIGQASIELIFDNADGKISGQFAGYNQISIKREVGRDAQSSYYLNGARCRRRDIRDVFLGTGLGPRSYSIIEQGMISELVEAKPDELRAHLEEVAGISKYKERRRETENRIHSTKENLNRINDLREELRLQINRLQRQSRAAKRYKVLKEEERLLKAQLLALRWMKLDDDARNFNSTISRQDTLLQSHLAELQSINTAIEKQRDLITNQGDQYREIQAKYYELGGEIARLEQTIQHQKELQQQLTLDLQQTEETWQAAQQSLSDDNAKLTELNQSLAELESIAKQAQDRTLQSQSLLDGAEQRMSDWQDKWDEFNARAAKTAQVVQVEQTRIQHLEAQQHTTSDRLDKISEEKQSVDAEILEKELNNMCDQVDQLHTKCEQITADLDSLGGQIEEQKNTNSINEDKVDELREKLHAKKAQYASLEVLQQAAVDQNEESSIKWLKNNGLSKKPRLARKLKVDDGWEQAVEMALGSYLQAVCVDSIDSIAKVLDSLDSGAVTLLDTNVGSNQSSLTTHNDLVLLRTKLHTDLPVDGLLQGIYVAGSLAEVLKFRKQLLPHESLITKDGVWVGQNWLRIARIDQSKPGVIGREKELTKLAAEIEQAERLFDDTTEALEKGRAQLVKLKQQREQLHQAYNNTQKQYLDIKAQSQIKQSELDQIEQLTSRLTKEYSEYQQFIESSKGDLAKANEILQQAAQEVAQHDNVREQLLEQRDECRRQLDQCKADAKADQTALYDAELALQSTQTKINSLQQAIARIEQQIASLVERRDTIKTNLTKQDDVPEGEIKQQLNELLEQRLLMEKELTEAKQRLSQSEHEVHTLEQKRRDEDEKVQQVRGQLEEQRLQGKEFKVRQATLQEQLADSSYELQTLIDEMPQEASIEAWQESIEQIATKIARLGPINLAAIEEHDEAAERKTYLDSQHDDLEEALTTLQNAIRKIDRETRAKFKETFDKVNENFQKFFPKIFGGGKAYLEMTGEDLLDTGVAVMAKPPGKHITNIHLLSGGEKALTAISLVFSLFQINPSPFCMLDEVDAPLDDANVGRFCELVKDMSTQVQFIFISHNTGTIEMANHLMGVTMNEPGVSRIVSVDIDAAVAMAEA
ncbi:MAG: chromosome segregation protein SMC [Gammaproteobacteria bacterium]|jgi:chromosome segregation protein